MRLGWIMTAIERAIQLFRGKPASCGLGQGLAGLAVSERLRLPVHFSPVPASEARVSFPFAGRCADTLPLLDGLSGFAARRAGPVFSDSFTHAVRRAVLPAIRRTAPVFCRILAQYVHARIRRILDRGEYACVRFPILFSAGRLGLPDSAGVLLRGGGTLFFYPSGLPGFGKMLSGGSDWGFP